MAEVAITLAEARQLALENLVSAEAERRVAAERDAKETACPGCAEKSSDLGKLKIENRYTKELIGNVRMHLRDMTAERDEAKARLEVLRHAAQRIATGTSDGVVELEDDEAEQPGCVGGIEARTIAQRALTALFED